jgi:hypothetical protein
MLLNLIDVSSWREALVAHLLFISRCRIIVNDWTDNVLLQSRNSAIPMGKKMPTGSKS